MDIETAIAIKTMVDSLEEYNEIVRILEGCKDVITVYDRYEKIDVIDIDQSKVPIIIEAFRNEADKIRAKIEAI